MAQRKPLNRAKAKAEKSKGAQSEQPVGSQSKADLTKRKIVTDRAPGPVGPYNQAIVVGNTIYVAGQGPADPKTRKVLSSNFEEQAAQVFENIKAVLEAAGASMSDVVKVNVYLADLSDFGKMNEVYKRYFPEDYPARTTIAAQLLFHMYIEADCIAVKNDL